MRDRGRRGSKREEEVSRGVMNCIDTIEVILSDKLRLLSSFVFSEIVQGSISITPNLVKLGTLLFNPISIFSLVFSRIRGKLIKNQSIFQLKM